jgi:hypothetical protein
MAGSIPASGAMPYGRLPNQMFMYTYEKNPFLKGEILVKNPSGDIVCRLMYNDFASVHESEPELEWVHMAEVLCNTMNHYLRRMVGENKEFNGL